jgi:ankyrin repeat protein
VSLNESALVSIYRADPNGVLEAINQGADVTQKDSDHRTLLMHAVLSEKYSTEVISILIDNGCPVNEKDKNQHWSALAFAARDCDPSVCELLIRAGAEVDSVDSFGNTPLWRAVMARKEANVALLQKYGANSEKENSSGISPYTLAKTLGVTYFEKNS